MKVIKNEIINEDSIEFSQQKKYVDNIFYFVKYNNNSLLMETPYMYISDSNISESYFFLSFIG